MEQENKTNGLSGTETSARAGKETDVLSKEETDERSVDELFRSLDAIVGKLEDDSVSLEESFRLYQTGMGLLKTCQDKIDRVEKQLVILDEDGGGYDE